MGAPAFSDVLAHPVWQADCKDLVPMQCAQMLDAKSGASEPVVRENPVHLARREKDDGHRHR